MRGGYILKLDYLSGGRGTKLTLQFRTVFAEPRMNTTVGRLGVTTAPASGAHSVYATWTSSCIAYGAL